MSNGTAREYYETPGGSAITMNEWLAGFAAKYGSIILGLGIGTSAKYGLTLSEGRELTWRMIVIDLLLIGFVAVMAANAVESMGLNGNGAVLVAAMFAVSSDRIIRKARSTFASRIMPTVDDLATLRGEARQAGAIVQSAVRNAEHMNAPSAIAKATEMSSPDPGTNSD